MATDLSHRPGVLYRASLERIDAAWALRENNTVDAFFLGGLAVECILQAHALWSGSSHDASHSLTSWLAKCSGDLQDAIKNPELVSHWNRIATIWQPSSRYWDHGALLGWAREQRVWRGYSGRNESKLTQFVKDFLISADEVHKKVVNRWLHATK